jgi:UDP-N-acetylmuramate dehydrogenase
VNIEQNIPLAPYTSLRLGGPARYLARCKSVAELQELLTWADERNLPTHVLGGGSNTVFDDAGFDGLVICVGLRGTEITFADDAALVTAAAGEDWDPLVASTIGNDLSGVECLSGIPGLVGATPLQNVGAYGQQVSELIVSVGALVRDTLEEIQVDKADCGFGYRTSRFKGIDRDRFIITSVTYRLRRGCRPEIRYQQLEDHLQEGGVSLDALSPGKAASGAVRDAVIEIRRSKSMVLDDADPNSRSAGSFFLNPVLTEAQLEVVHQSCRSMGVASGEIPVFPTSGGLQKLSAAWLVEASGFPRGTRRTGAGISDKHALALVSHGDSAADLLVLASEVSAAVQASFGVTLEREPVYVPARGT